VEALFSLSWRFVATTDARTKLRMFCGMDQGESCGPSLLHNANFSGVFAGCGKGCLDLLIICKVLIADERI